MVCVRVGQHDDVKLTNARPCQRGSQDACGRPSVDEHRLSAVPVEDGIPLADIEHRETWLRRSRQPERQQHRRHHNAYDRATSGWWTFGQRPETIQRDQCAGERHGNGHAASERHCRVGRGSEPFCCCGGNSEETRRNREQHTSEARRDERAERAGQTDVQRRRNEREHQDVRNRRQQRERVELRDHERQGGHLSDGREREGRGHATESRRTGLEPCGSHPAEDHEAADREHGQLESDVERGGRIEREYHAGRDRERRDWVGSSADERADRRDDRHPECAQCGHLEPGHHCEGTSCGKSDHHLRAPSRA